MRIEAVDCQKIVNRVISILGKNINIMNSEGIIIASGNKSRVGTFHEAARLAAQTKEEIIVDTETMFVGCKKGINLPIYSGRQVIGVIGITGEPSEVKGYGVIVKELVEMMIQEAERKTTELYQQQALRNFASELIKEQDAEGIEALQWRAQLVGFDILVPRTVMVVDISKFGAVIKGFKKNVEIKAQEYKQSIMDIISSLSSADNDIIFNTYEDHFVILKSLDTKLEGYCTRLHENISSRLGVAINIGIGSTCKDIADYNKSYILADSTLKIGRRLKPEKLFYNWSEYKLEFLLQSIPESSRNQFLSSFDKLFSEGSEMEKELQHTIKAYFEQGMNIQAVSKALYVHRNTVLYRLNRLKEQYGIDVMNKYDCMLIYIGIVMKDLF